MINKENKSLLPFKKVNYIWLLTSIGLISIGFWIMSLEKAPHGLGFLGLTLGPILLLSGFSLVFMAIFRSK